MRVDGDQGCPFPFCTSIAADINDPVSQFPATICNLRSCPESVPTPLPPPQRIKEIMTLLMTEPVSRLGPQGREVPGRAAEGSWGLTPPAVGVSLQGY